MDHSLGSNRQTSKRMASRAVAEDLAGRHAMNEGPGFYRFYKDWFRGNQGLDHGEPRIYNDWIRGNHDSCKML